MKSLVFGFVMFASLSSFAVSSPAPFVCSFNLAAEVESGEGLSLQQISNRVDVISLFDDALNGKGPALDYVYGSIKAENPKFKMKYSDLALEIRFMNVGKKNIKTCYEMADNGLDYAVAFFGSME